MEKINHLLRERFGFSLASDISTGKLDTLYTKIADDLYNLKLDLRNVQSKDYAQKLLVAEGLKMMLDDRKEKIEALREAHLVGPGARRYEAALEAAAADVEHECSVGDDYEDAIKDAMKAYRSSELRFSDEMFEFDLREMTKHCTLDSQIGEYEGGPDFAMEEAGPEKMARKYIPGVGKMQARKKAAQHRDAAYFTSSVVGPENRGAPASDADFHDDNRVADREWRDHHRYSRIARGEKPFAKEELEEEAPPGMESWIKDRKEDFKKQYGDDWQEVLYATAWKEYNKKNESVESPPVRDVVDWSDVMDAGKKVARDVHGKVDMQKLKGIISNAKKHKPDSTASAIEHVKQMLRTDETIKEDAGHSILDIITPEELDELRGFISGARPYEDFYGTDVFDKLYRYYAFDNAEMPYEIAKGRGGDVDADQWILDRVEQDYGDEVLGMEEGRDAAMGKQAEREWRGQSSNRSQDYFDYQKEKTTDYRKKPMKEGYVKQLRKLLEAEVEQAESLIAARGFSQELQDMVEKLGRLVNEDLPAVSEQMRDSHGADVATGFEDAVSGTLNAIMDQLRDSKQELDNSVSAIADGGMPSATNDMDDFGDEEDIDLDVDADVDLEDGDDELDLGDELDDLEGMDAAAGGEEEPLGRAKKESMQRLQRRIVEMKQKVARAKKQRRK